MFWIGIALTAAGIAGAIMAARWDRRRMEEARRKARAAGCICDIDNPIIWEIDPNCPYHKGVM